MTIAEFLAQNTQKLKAADIDSARLDCLILLEDALDRDRASILASPDTPLPTKTLTTLEAQIAERSKQMPLAYLRGKAEFYARSFRVTPHVLVPRPESEDIITLLKGIALPDHSSIADIGTGSGCLAVTAALEIGKAQVDAYDISPEAIVVAKQNSVLHRQTIDFRISDLLQGLGGTYDVFLANLPYVPDSYPVNAAAKHEPTLALYAGSDGLTLYRRLFTECTDLPKPPLYIITEALPMQHQQLAALAAKHGYDLTNTLGYAQLFTKH